MSEPKGDRVNLVVECACGWVTRGEENQVIEAMQVHTRQIHGREITREEVLAQAKQGSGRMRNHRRPTIRYVGGPTAVLEMGGLRLLTDPTFDPSGPHPVGSRVLVKTSGPAVPPDALGPVDLVLLSHDQHPDNLDTLGREYLQGVPLVLSTAQAQDRLGGTVRALPNWEQTELPCPDGRTLRLTGVPAQHGPDGTEHIVGEVTGFVLERDDFPRTYVSGDNASLNVVRAVADQLGPVDVAILFAGAAQTALVPGAYLTLTSEAVAQAAEILGARAVVPLHFEGWTHFTQGRDTLVTAFDRAGLADRLHLPRPGEWTDL